MTGAWRSHFALVVGLLSGVILTAMVGLIPSDAMAHDIVGDGDVHDSRLPWGDSTWRQLTTGWAGVPGGCPPTQGTGHCPGTTNQYAVDWGGYLWVAAVSEGSVTCSTENEDSIGAEVKVTRADGFVDRYIHLYACPEPPYDAHVEQGDLFVYADGSGSISSGPHLHYQKNSTSGWSQRIELSGLDDFCTNPATSLCGPDTYHDLFFASDNAGPGVGDGIPLWTGGAIWLAYTNIGHFSCSGKAYDCFGSSKSVLGEGRKAVAGCLGSPQDCGWSQTFKEMASTGGKHHGFGKPGGCASAYWGPDGFFWAWLVNANDLGYPRTNMYYIPTQPPGLSTGAGWYQWFRYGYLYSAVTTSASPYYNVQTTGCS